MHVLPPIYGHITASDAPTLARAPRVVEEHGGRVFFHTDPEAPPDPGFQPEAPPEPAAAAPEPPAAPPEAPLPPGAGAALSEDRIMEIVGQAFDERLSRYAPDPYAQQPQQPQQPAAQLPAWDPYDPQSVMAHMGAMLDERFAGLAPQLQGFGEIADYVAEREAETELNSIFDNMARPEGEGGIGGEFDRSMARARAEAFIEMNPHIDVNRALERAARDQYAYEEGLRHQGAERYQEQARLLRENGPDPVGPGVPPVTPDTTTDPRELAREDVKKGLDPFEEAAKRTAAKLGVAV